MYGILFTILYLHLVDFMVNVGGSYGYFILHQSKNVSSFLARISMKMMNWEGGGKDGKGVPGFKWGYLIL